MKAEEVEKPNAKGDRLNMMIIILMFIVEGVVQGVVAAIPVVLENRKVSYEDQAEFSITSWLCLKILLAPIIDCVYSKKFGRRKTWLIPVQYMMGITLLFASMNLDNWLGSEDGTRSPNVRALTAIFFAAMFLNSVQDISLDGWTLNMLQKRNVGYVGNCQNVGATMGFSLSYVLFIVLDSKDFCNRFRSIPRDHGFVSSANFLLFLSVVFFVSTTMILFFMKENSRGRQEDDESECSHSLVGSYKLLWRIFHLRPIIVISSIYSTCFITDGPQFGVAPLKLLEAGVPQEDLVLFTLWLLPLQLISSAVFNGWVTGPRTLRSFLLLNVFQFLTGVALAVVLFFSSSVKNGIEPLPAWYYWTLLFAFIAGRLAKHLTYVTISSFGCRVSDPRYGGIYLTLIWTMVSVGQNWPRTLSLYCVDWLAMRICTGNEVTVMSHYGLLHDVGKLEKKQSSQQGTDWRKLWGMTERRCFNLDGFYTEVILFTAIATFWLLWWCRREMNELEKLDASAWIAEEKLPEVTGDGTNKNAID